MQRSDSMKILLVKLSSRRLYEGPNETRFEPLGLEYLAAVLQGGHEAKMLDLEAQPLEGRALDHYLQDFGPEVVGATVHTAILRRNTE